MEMAIFVRVARNTSRGYGAFLVSFRCQVCAIDEDHFIVDERQVIFIREHGGWLVRLDDVVNGRQIVKLRLLSG